VPAPSNPILTPLDANSELMVSRDDSGLGIFDSIIGIIGGTKRDFVDESFNFTYGVGDNMSLGLGWLLRSTFFHDQADYGGSSYYIGSWVGFAGDLLMGVGAFKALGKTFGREALESGLRNAPNRTLHSADGYIGKFVEGTVTKEVLDQVRLIATAHPTLQRRGFGALFIDAGTAVDKYVKKLHGIFLRAPENAVPRGVLAEEIQHAIDVTSGFHSPQRIAALRRANPSNYNDVWHKGVFNRIADALENDPHSIFHFFLNADDAAAFRRAAEGLPR
jgi:hypothetical protein